jgi:hypothetical protein
MKITFLAFALASVFLTGCEKIAPPKVQEVIFEVQSISCKGSNLCDTFYIPVYKEACTRMNVSLQSKLSEGWKVVVAIPKEKAVPIGSNDKLKISCEGTEYIIEK